MKYAIYGNKTYHELIRNVLKHHEYDVLNPDFVFSCGGDGTVLRAVQEYLHCNPIFIGINVGKLGFYTDFEINEINDIISLIEKKAYKEEAYSLLDYQLINDLETNNGFALNELALISPVHTHIIEVYIDGDHFETFRGTGFLVSTSTGSTAYNKSCGGSVIDPKLEAMQLTEVASINNRIYKTIASPLIFSKNTIIELRADFSKTYLSVDGIELAFKKIQKIQFSISKQKARFITRPNYDFWSRVKKSFLN